MAEWINSWAAIVGVVLVILSGLAGCIWWASALYSQVRQIANELHWIRTAFGEHESKVWCRLDEDRELLHKLDKRVSKLEPTS